MRWQGQRRSSNVEDRRRTRARGGGAKLGGGAALIVMVIAIGMALTGRDPSALLEATGVGQGGTQPAGGQAGGSAAPLPPPSAEEDEQAEFVAVILGTTEEIWRNIFRDLGRAYEEPRLVLFREAVDSACGMQSSAVGPFYCPADKQVYIDLSFFEQLDRRFGAPGDFAQAYVVAHEVGHHVQTLLGVSARVHAERRQLPEVEANRLTVRQELQADCYSGVWAYHVNQRQPPMLEAGDLEEGLRAAAAIGDDTLQRRAGGRVSPESWTHGSSEQRVRWFREGFATGDMLRCDTFNGPI
ncbi:MAG: neutral zinc metallopeptidase [Myxococcota bacterium]